MKEDTAQSSAALHVTAVASGQREAAHKMMVMRSRKPARVRTDMVSKAAAKGASCDNPELTINELNPSVLFQLSM